VQVAVTPAGREDIGHPSNLIEPLNSSIPQNFYKSSTDTDGTLKVFGIMATHFLQTMKEYNSESRVYFTEYIVNGREAL
jgi:hypothetical protein